MIRRTSIKLDLELVAEVRSVLRTRGVSDTIQEALMKIVRDARLKELAQKRFDDLPPETLTTSRSPPRSL